MDIGLVTIAYNDYGRFLPQWCQSIADLTIAPSRVTIVLGAFHGLTSTDEQICNSLIPNIEWIHYKGPQKMGALRNVGVSHTHTEWIQYLSADDVILPWAIEEYELLEQSSDYIVIRWQSIKTWEEKPFVREHTPRLPIEMAQLRRGRGFINNQSPYRRWIWEQNPYMEHDYPNAPFLAGAVELGTRFARTERPCTVYLKRLDSHCGKNLGQRKIDGSIQIRAYEKRQARFWQKDAANRIFAHYCGVE